MVLPQDWADESIHLIDVENGYHIYCNYDTVRDCHINLTKPEFSSLLCEGCCVISAK